MIAVDTSVAVAAFGEWHELNERAGATLLTADRRAVPVYEALGVRFELL